MPRHLKQRALMAPLLAATLTLPASAWAQSGPYLRGGLGMDWSDDTRFEDQDCSRTDPPALFGCVAGSDGEPLGAGGDFGEGAVLDAAIGYRFSPRLRAEALLSYRPDMDFAGEADFLNVPGRQPVSADMRSLGVFAVGYVDLPPMGRLQPFIGAGIGAAHNRIGSVTYGFPGLGANAATVIRGGSHTDLAYLVTLGAAVPLTDRLTLDIAYRYTDLGEVRTDSGTATIVRNSGTRTLDIAGIQAELKTHGVMASLRYDF